MSGVLRIGLLSLAIAGSGLAPAAQSAQEVRDIQACMAKNLVSRGALRELTLQSDDGAKVTVNVYWRTTDSQTSSVNLRVKAPEDLAGSSYLSTRGAAGDALYVYLPELGKATRLSGPASSQPLWGTDFTHQDLLRAQGVLGGEQAVRKPDGEAGGRPAYVLQSPIDEADSRYAMLLSYIDKQSCTLLKAEYYSYSGTTPAKILQADTSLLFDIETDEKTVWMVLGYTVRDLERDSSSRLSLSEISLLEDLPPQAFQPDSFYQPFRHQDLKGETHVYRQQ